jgi:hypothetical protein
MLTWTVPSLSIVWFSPWRQPSAPAALLSPSTGTKRPLPQHGGGNSGTGPRMSSGGNELVFSTSNIASNTTINAIAVDLEL